MARDDDASWQLPQSSSVYDAQQQAKARQARANQLLSSFDPASDAIVQQLIAQQAAETQRGQALQQTPAFDPNPPQQAQAFTPPSVVADDSDIAALIGSTEAGAQGRGGPTASFAPGNAVPTGGVPRAVASRRSLSGSGALIPDDNAITNTLASTGAGAARSAPVQSKEARKLPTQGKF